MASMTSDPLRLAALAAGEAKFDPGCKCDRGHVSLRYVRNAKCITCGVIGDWKRRHGKDEKAYWRAQAKARATAKVKATKAAAQINARKAVKPKITKPKVTTPRRKIHRPPMIGEDYNVLVTQERLVEASRRFLVALHREAMASLGDHSHA